MTTIQDAPAAIASAADELWHGRCPVLGEPFDVAARAADGPLRRAHELLAASQPPADPRPAASHPSAEIPT